jgi:hypothetical protein
MHLGDKKRAWELAHKRLSLVKVIPEREGKELLVVRTEEICKAMGGEEKAKLEDVQRFVFDIIAFLKTYGMYIACGCGYLSLMICPMDRHEFLIAERDTTGFVPKDLEDYFEKHVLTSSNVKTEEVKAICDKPQ